MRRLRRLVYVHWGGKMCEERCNHCLQIHKEALLRGWGSIFLGGWYKQAEDITVLRCSREQLVKKYVGKLYNSSNSLVTEQAAKAGSRGTSTGDIRGRDESPICQGWFRCNQTCHNVQQWSGWCTRGLFSPKWVCDLSFVPNSVCGTVCANVCTWCLMFPYASAAQMSPGWYCLLVQALSLCLFLSYSFAPPWYVSLTFLHLLLSDPLFLCDLLSICLYFTYPSVCSPGDVHAPELVYTHPFSCSLRFPPPACPVVRAAHGEVLVRRRIFLATIRAADNHPVLVWKL